MDLAGGIGFDWRLTERWTLGLGFEAWAAGHRSDIRALSLSLRYSR